MLQTNLYLQQPYWLWASIIHLLYYNDICSIQVTYGYVVGNRHGSSQGNNEVVILLNPGEFIWAVDGYAGKEVDMLTFFTNYHSFGPFCGTGGDQFFVYHTYPPNTNTRLRWFSGKANARLDRLSFHFQC